jgi:uncharacterized protein YyaL (SSP411 family)
MQEAVKKFYKNGTWYMSDDAFESKAAFYDASYVTAKAIMIEDIFKIALLSDNLKLHAFAKDSLEWELSAVQATPSQYPYGLKVVLQNIHAWVVLKSTKSNLQRHREQLDAIKYPFLLLKPSPDEKFIACKIDVCFGVDSNLKNVILKIDAL